jgi:uncharacterized protein (TIGR02145 family)
MFTNAASLLVAAAVLAAGGALPAWKHVQAQTAVTDFDGISYRTVTIGRQAWMAENVRSTRACDGTPVAHDAHPGGQDLVNTYGRLYTEAAARMGEPAGSDSPSGVRGICPCGWHLPSDGEWQQFVDVPGGLCPVVGSHRLKSLARWTSQAAKYAHARRQPKPIDPQRLARFAGSYEGRMVALVEGRLASSRVAGALGAELVPLGGDKFALRATQFLFEEQAGTVALTVEQPDGTQVTFTRSPIAEPAKTRLSFGAGRAERDG